MRRLWNFVGARPRLAVMLTTLIAYLTALFGPFQFDDYAVIVRYAPVHSYAGWWAALAHGIRPLLKLTYTFNWVLGAGAFGFHVFNLAVHVINTDLVMRMYSAASDRKQRWPFASIDRGAIATGVLFSIHPIQTEAVTYISARSSSLTTCFILLALLLYVEGARSRTPWVGIGLSLACFTCALLTKESAATLPLGLVLWELCFERPRWRELLIRQAPFACLVLGILAAALMHQSYYSLLYQTLGARPLLDSALYQVEGAVYLLSRLLWINRLSIDPGLGQHVPGPLLVAAGCAALAVLSLVALHQRRARPLVTFGIGWFFLQVLIPYTLLPRLDVINERHLYLANAGIFAGVGSIWAELSSRAKWSMWQSAGVAIAGLLAIGTVQRNLNYRSRIALWESTTRVSPSNPRAYNNLGVAYESAGRHAEARAAYAHALALRPEYDVARTNLRRVELLLAAR